MAAWGVRLSLDDDEDPEPERPGRRRRGASVLIPWSIVVTLLAALGIVVVDDGSLRAVVSDPESLREHREQSIHVTMGQHKAHAEKVGLILGHAKQEIQRLLKRVDRLEEAIRDMNRELALLSAKLSKAANQQRAFAQTTQP